MQRENSVPRPDWKAALESQGLRFHSVGGVYWDESARYHFSEAEIDQLEAVSNELHAMCMDAVGRIVSTGRLETFNLPSMQQGWIVESWLRGDPHLYGRFDLAWNGMGDPKLLEYNADTPTALIEASVAQWHWLEALLPDRDQFNSIHEKLIARWAAIKSVEGVQTQYFGAAAGSEEDQATAAYLADCAAQAGLAVRAIDMSLIGWDSASLRFVDEQINPIERLFKLYPTEWMLKESFGPQLVSSRLRLTEPPWKLLLSSKAILPLLWEWNTGHPNLLPSFNGEPPRAGSWVKKPIYSREGGNISFIENGITRQSSAGDYASQPVIHQQPAPLYQSGSTYAVIGSWVVGDEAAGIGMREDQSRITSNLSHFVPHYFD